MILLGDSLQSLKTLPDGRVRCCVTSPPYWGLRDYGHAGQIGLERTPEEYVSRIVDVFREVRRVLADDGTLWLNLGDSYSSNQSNKSTLCGFTSPDTKGRRANKGGGIVRLESGLKPKDLVGIPWRVAFALQADGWWLRQDIIWHKPNPMPESVTDRCTKAHEYVFLLSKSKRYYFDAKAISERAVHAGKGVVLGEKSLSRGQAMAANIAASGNGKAKSVTVKETRNKRSVWTIAPQPFREAHFAVMPEELARLCVVAGSEIDDTVLDPFSGAGTVGVVSKKTGRKYIGCEINPRYVAMSKWRLLRAFLK